MDKLKKRKIVIYGAGQIGQLAIIALQEILYDFEDQVLGCAVTALNNNPDFLENVKVRELDSYVNSESNILYLIAVKEIYRDQVVRELHIRGIYDYEYFDYKKCIEILENMWKIQNQDRFIEFKTNMEQSILSDEDYILFLSRQLKGILNFEINLADHCNLNCQCCNHFSPIADKVFIDCEQLERDLKQLNSLLGYRIGKVMLLGGEPLLHPQIQEVLKISRKYMPSAHLTIISNGLLLPKMGEDFWRLIKESNISLNVTKYPINFDYKSCERKAEQYGIHISYGYLPEPIKTTYHLPIKDVAEFNPYHMYIKCKHANECVVLREGRLYTCPLAANVHYYNKYFKKSIPEGEDVSIDIYSAANWEEIEEFLKRPNKMCGHCDIYHYTYDIPWAISKKDVHEWS